MRDATIDLFNKYIGPQRHDFYISGVVLSEIDHTPDQSLREKFHKAIDDYDLPQLDIKDFVHEIRRLTEQYVRMGIIPQKKFEDAMHVAISTVHQMDALLSWNFQHLANIFRERRIMSININEGYMKPLRITTPYEVMEDENQDT